MIIIIIIVIMLMRIIVNNVKNTIDLVNYNSNFQSLNHERVCKSLFIVLCYSVINRDIYIYR